LEAIGAALTDNGKVIVTGCMGAEPEKIIAGFPNVLAITGPQQYESILNAFDMLTKFGRKHPLMDEGSFSAAIKTSIAGATGRGSWKTHDALYFRKAESRVQSKAALRVRQ